MSNAAPPPVYTFTMSYQTARCAAEFIMREFPPPDDYRPYQIVDEIWANLRQDSHSECGPDCPDCPDCPARYCQIVRIYGTG